MSKIELDKIFSGMTNEEVVQLLQDYQKKQKEDAEKKAKEAQAQKDAELEKSRGELILAIYNYFDNLGMLSVDGEEATIEDFDKFDVEMRKKLKDIEKQMDILKKFFTM